MMRGDYVAADWRSRLPVAELHDQLPFPGEFRPILITDTCMPGGSEPPHPANVDSKS
jgi:hypothetical protein